MFYWFVCRMLGHKFFKLSAGKLFTQVWILHLWHLIWVWKGRRRGKAEEVIFFTREYCYYFYTFLLNASLWKPRDWAFNARKLCKSRSSPTVHVSFSEVFCLMKRWFVKCSGAVVQLDPWFMCGICWVGLKAKFSCWCCKVTLVLLS